jgi:hypothetical protein
MSTLSLVQGRPLDAQNINSQTLNLSIMTPDAKDELFFGLIVANAQATTKLQKHVTKLTQKLNNAKVRAADLEQTVDQQKLALDGICTNINQQALKALQVTNKKTLQLKKESVWKERVLSKLLEDNPSTRPDELNQLYLTNQNTRQQLRAYIKEYKINKIAIHYYKKPNRVKFLIHYAKLLLRDNPLYSWEELKPMLDSAKHKIDNPPIGYVKGFLGYIDYDDGWFKNVIDPTERDINSFESKGNVVEVIYYYELETSYAPQILFKNPNVSSKGLYTQRRKCNWPSIETEPAET